MASSRRHRRFLALPLIATALALPAQASASTATWGVSGNLDNAVINSGYLDGAGPPYNVYASGTTTGEPAYYAPMDGFLTRVAMAHANPTAAQTVKILIYQYTSGINMKVVSAPLSMSLPAVALPGAVTSQDVTTQVPVHAGDRIGYTITGGSGPLYNTVDNSSPVLAHGTYHTGTLINSEPMAGEEFTFNNDTANGPLIQGTVSTDPPGGGGTTPPPTTTPLTEPPARIASSKPTTKDPTKLPVSVGCFQVTTAGVCQGKITIQPKAPARAAASASSKPYGSASFNIPAGVTKKVKVKLSKAAQKTLKKKGKLKAYAVIAMDVDGQHLTSATKITAKLKK